MATLPSPSRQLLLLLAASHAFSQAAPPGGFVKMPESLHCSMHNAMQAGGASTGGQWVLSSVGSLSCSANGKSEQDVPLVSGVVTNGIIATKSFGDFYIAGGGFSFQIYIRSEQLEPFAQFLGAAAVAPARSAPARTVPARTDPAETAPAKTPSAKAASPDTEKLVHIRPPAPIAETRLARPDPDHVWLAGYQSWSGSAYVWVPGRWELPPRPHARWVAPHWLRRHGGWVLVEGHWR